VPSGPGQANDDPNKGALELVAAAASFARKENGAHPNHETLSKKMIARQRKLRRKVLLLPAAISRLNVISFVEEYSIPLLNSFKTKQERSECGLPSSFTDNAPKPSQVALGGSIRALYSVKETS
jgi:hypothetical protein